MNLYCTALAMLAWVTLTAGCAEAPGAKTAAEVQADAKTVSAESTPEKLFARGRAFAMVGDFTRAEQYLAAALAKGAPSKSVLPLLLKVCIAEQRYRVAISYAETELKKAPRNNPLRFVVASLYATIGDTKVAREQMERVIESDPDDASVRYALAVLLRDDERDVGSADAHFRAYLRLDPKGPHAEEARGSLLRTVP
jgi:tetratricopeptide (TPR) repeat protein